MKHNAANASNLGAKVRVASWTLVTDCSRLAITPTTSIPRRKGVTR
jgi:hypothetical protein